MERLEGGQPIEYKLVPLTKGKFSKVDNDDFDSINSELWLCTPLGYALRRVGGKGVWMHRVITNCPIGLEVDHINGDKLDNRKSNLRICTKKENQGNRWKSKHAKTSIYKGVCFCKKLQRFAAYGRVGPKNRRLGTFRDERDAAIAYNKWAVEYFGEFARLNPV